MEIKVNGIKTNVINENEFVTMIQNGQEIKINLEDEEPHGSMIFDHQLINFKLNQLSVDIFVELINNGEQVSGYMSIPQGCPVYEYGIYNDGEYEFASHYELHSNKFFTKEEFDAMVQEAIDNGCDDDFKVLAWLKKNKGFFHVTRAQSVCIDRPWREEHSHLPNKFQILYR